MKLVEAMRMHFNFRNRKQYSFGYNKVLNIYSFQQYQLKLEELTDTSNFRKGEKSLKINFLNTAIKSSHLLGRKGRVY